ncbi:hypothetical protein KAU08_09095, partial [bacterium]|nr:hypothetical protein [bacterium]
EGSLGLLVADISTLPAFPTILSRIDAGSGPNMFVKLHKSSSGLTAYTLSDGVGIVVCDLTIPESPYETATLNHPAVTSMDCDNQYLAVGTENGVKVYELTDPLNPAYLGVLTPMDNLDGQVWDVDIQGSSLWSRTDHSIVRYDLSSGWPPESEYRTYLYFTIGWMEVEWPFIVDGAQISTSDYGSWVYPIDNWQEFDAQKLIGPANYSARLTLDESHLYLQAGAGVLPFMDSLWYSLHIYNWSDFAATYPYYPDYAYKVFIPGYLKPSKLNWGGPEIIKEDNRIFMARGTIDLATIRLW